MIEYKAAGKTVDQRGFVAALESAALQIIKDQVRDRFAAMRNPSTGEFPTVIVEGNSVDALQIIVEASAATLAIVRQSLSPEEAKGLTYRERLVPKAFLSYAKENRVLAQRIAEELQANGIDTWWAEWEIGAGDSLRQKIEEGLKNCTHFIVLLTQQSIAKAWVNQEMDAGLVRKLQEKCAFIPLRCGFPASDLPPLLSGVLSPEVDESSFDLKQLISDIHGFTRKPPLGEAPAPSAQVSTGYSKAATAAARYFVESSPNGLFGDVQFSIADVMKHTGLSENDAKDAVHELGSLIHPIHYDVGTPKDELYVRFDGFWKGWDPKEDALKLAADLMNDESFPRVPREIASKYDWPARRLNPAMAYLVNRNQIRAVKGLGGGQFVVHLLHPTEDTRRFVSSRS